MTSALTTGLVVLVVYSLVLFVLDLRERIRTRPEEVGAATLSWHSGLFVVVVLTVYSAIQFAGVALVPSVAQVFEGVSGLAAVLHVVEHFSWHTGQVAWIVKLRTGGDLGYYEMPLE